MALGTLAVGLFLVLVTLALAAMGARKFAGVVLGISVFLSVGGVALAIWGGSDHDTCVRHNNDAYNYAAAHPGVSADIWQCHPGHLGLHDPF